MGFAALSALAGKAINKGPQRLALRGGDIRGAAVNDLLSLILAPQRATFSPKKVDQRIIDLSRRIGQAPNRLPESMLLQADDPLAFERFNSLGSTQKDLFMDMLSTGSNNPRAESLYRRLSEARGTAPDYGDVVLPSNELQRVMVKGKVTNIEGDAVDAFIGSGEVNPRGRGRGPEQMHIGEIVEKWRVEDSLGGTTLDLDDLVVLDRQHSGLRGISRTTAAGKLATAKNEFVSAYGIRYQNNTGQPLTSTIVTDAIKAGEDSPEMLRLKSNVGSQPDIDLDPTRTELFRAQEQSRTARKPDDFFVNQPSWEEGAPLFDKGSEGRSSKGKVPGPIRRASGLKAEAVDDIAQPRGRYVDGVLQDYGTHGISSKIDKSLIDRKRLTPGEWSEIMSGSVGGLALHKRHMFDLVVDYHGNGMLPGLEKSRFKYKKQLATSENLKNYTVKDLESLVRTGKTNVGRKAQNEVLLEIPKKAKRTKQAKEVFEPSDGALSADAVLEADRVRITTMNKILGRKSATNTSEAGLGRRFHENPQDAYIRIHGKPKDGYSSKYATSDEEIVDSFALRPDEAAAAIGWDKVREIQISGGDITREEYGKLLKKGVPLDKNAEEIQSLSGSAMDVILGRSSPQPKPPGISGVPYEELGAGIPKKIPLGNQEESLLPSTRLLLATEKGGSSGLSGGTRGGRNLPSNYTGGDPAIDSINKLSPEDALDELRRQNRKAKRDAVQSTLDAAPDGPPLAGVVPKRKKGTKLPLSVGRSGIKINPSSSARKLFKSQLPENMGEADSFVQEVLHLGDPHLNVTGNTALRKRLDGWLDEVVGPGKSFEHLNVSNLDPEDLQDLYGMLREFRGNLGYLRKNPEASLGLSSLATVTARRSPYRPR